MKRFVRHTRPLSHQERQIALSVFGDSLNLEPIRLKTAWWVIKGYAVSPNGHIYFHVDDFCADFGKESLNKRAWFVHELVHVWQVQQGMAVFWRALFNRRYRYGFVAGKHFLHYGIEQQARMVEDYYIRRELGRDCTPWLDCVPFLSSTKQLDHANSR